MTDQHLRNYKIIQKLGEGGMATVYLAEHADLGHKVAIKILNKEFTYHQNIRNRFIDEAKKMVRMDHPNVVKVTDLINDPDTVAIVMEYVDGETLRDVLSRKKLTDSEIENYLKQMVAALDYVHAQGLVHRDIKPSNFIFNVKGVLKLTDFGISKSIEGELDGHTQTGTAMSMGTPMYMSPEQIRSIKDVTYLSDIYSLGVVLYQMVSRQKPYPIDTLSAFDLQLKIVQEKLPLTGTYWDSTIQKATEKLEEKRFQSAGEVLSEKESLEEKNINLNKVDEDRTIAFVRPEIKKETNKIKEKPKKNKKMILWIGGALATIVIIAMFVGYFTSPDSDGDGVTDRNDPYPYEYGGENGVPAYRNSNFNQIHDRDSDGLNDDIDNCPDVSGISECDGCPCDSDKDGVVDSEDKCIDEPGILECDGCPCDKDGDGIMIPWDECPNEKGLKENNGCPKIIVPSKGKIKSEKNVKIDNLVKEFKEDCPNPNCHNIVSFYTGQTFGSCYLCKRCYRISWYGHFSEHHVIQIVDCGAIFD